MTKSGLDVEYEIGTEYWMCIKHIQFNKLQSTNSTKILVQRSTEAFMLQNINKQRIHLLVKIAMTIKNYSFLLKLKNWTYRINHQAVARPNDPRARNNCIIIARTYE